MASHQYEEYQERLVRDNKFSSADDEDDTSLNELLDDLENGDDDEFMSRYREERVQRLADDMKQIRKNVQNEDYGTLTTFRDESALMRLTSQKEQVVIHFYLDSFQKCAIMDKKLEILAERHLMTRFLRINVQDCPFLVSKLDIKVLPCLIAYKNGVERERVVGFSRLGNDPNDFTVATLETLLLNCGVLAKKANKLYLVDSKRSEDRSQDVQSDSDNDLDI